jgi:hypothetical protein
MFPLFFRSSKEKVRWETVAVTLDGLVKAKRGDAIKLRKIDIEPALG